MSEKPTLNQTYDQLSDDDKAMLKSDDLGRIIMAVAINGNQEINFFSDGSEEIKRDGVVVDEWE